MSVRIARIQTHRDARAPIRDRFVRHVAERQPQDRYQRRPHLFHFRVAPILRASDYAADDFRTASLVLFLFVLHQAL